MNKISENSQKIREKYYKNKYFLKIIFISYIQIKNLENKETIMKNEQKYQ